MFLWCFPSFPSHPPSPSPITRCCQCVLWPEGERIHGTGLLQSCGLPHYCDAAGSIMSRVIDGNSPTAPPPHAGKQCETLWRINQSVDEEQMSQFAICRHSTLSTLTSCYTHFIGRVQTWNQLVSTMYHPTSRIRIRIKAKWDIYKNWINPVHVPGKFSTSRP